MLTKIQGVLFDLIESALRNLGSVVGVYLRRAYYKRRLKACGSNLRIDCGVFLVNPRYVSLGDHVILDKHVIIIAGPAGDALRTKYVSNRDCETAPGEVIIGSHSHLGIGTIVQGHGGVGIGDYFTSSSRCMIYSLSNDPRRCRSGTVGGVRHDVHYIETPVKIGRNVWLGLQSIVIGNTIGDDVFAKPYSVITKDISENRIVAGSPASEMGSRFEPDPNVRSECFARSVAGSSE